MATDADLERGTCDPHLLTGYSSLSLTHVLYPTGAVHSKLLAYVTLLPLAMLVSYVTLVVSRWKMSIWRVMLAGQLTNEAINAGLKWWIRSHRPSPCHGDGYGMPSSHAQFMAYFWAFGLLLVRHERNRIDALHPLLRNFLVSAITGATVLVIYSRVHLLYHSTAQVLAGAALGVAFGTLWYAVARPENPFGPPRRGSVNNAQPHAKIA